LLLIEVEDGVKTIATLALKHESALKRKSISIQSQTFINKITYETVSSHIYFPTQKSLIFVEIEGI